MSEQYEKPWASQVVYPLNGTMVAIRQSRYHLDQFSLFFNEELQAIFPSIEAAKKAARKVLFG